MRETESVAEQGQRNACVHHWVLGELQRGSFNGTCRRCGSQRAFSAVLEVPAPAPEGEEEPVLDVPALATAVSSLGKHTLI
jgi:hypothetical protein